MNNNSVHCCSRSFRFWITFFLFIFGFAVVVVGVPNQKLHTDRDKNTFGLAFATINFIVRSLITWSIITIMIQCFLHFREKERHNNNNDDENKKWKHNQAEFVTLQSDIWPFTTILDRRSHSNSQMCLPVCASQSRSSIRTPRSHSNRFLIMTFVYCSIWFWCVDSGCCCFWGSSSPHLNRWQFEAK